jgi:DNA-binding Xre family transcriptional regulator
VKLREAMVAHSKRTGERLTYAKIAQITGLDEETIQSLAVRPAYNPRLSTIALVCAALECSPGDLLDLRFEE